MPKRRRGRLDSFEAMEARRAAFEAGPRRRWPWQEALRLPGYQPHEIARLARRVRDRIQRWRARRQAP